MIRKIVPHVTIAMSLMLIVLFLIDNVNSAMGFLRGDVFKTLLIIYCAASTTTALILVIHNERTR